MAARYQEAEAATHQVPLTELERALEQLTQQVAEQKRQLTDTFTRIHQMVSQREAELVAQLDAIPAGISAKIEERRASLEQLTQIREEIEKKIQANRLNEFLQKQLSDIQNEIEQILSEQIMFPHFSLRCDEDAIKTLLKDKCLILSLNNPYTFRSNPIWHGVKRGKGKEELFMPEAICIDPSTQLIYVGDCKGTNRIQVFTSEGMYHSTLHNKQLDYCRSMKIHGDHIYVSNAFNGILKLNKRGKTLSFTYRDVAALFVEGMKLYTCVYESLRVPVYDLNLKPEEMIELKAKSFDYNITPRDVIVHNQQLFILFSYSGDFFNFSDPIQIFQLDGTLIRSLEMGMPITNALYFCLDSNENILVSDNEGPCLRIFSPDGHLLKSIGREVAVGTKVGEFSSPQGLAVNSKGRIFIVDRKVNNMLQVF